MIELFEDVIHKVDGILKPGIPGTQNLGRSFLSMNTGKKETFFTGRPAERGFVRDQGIERQVT